MTDESSDEINLLSSFKIIYRRKIIIILIVFIVTIIAILVSGTLPKYYKAEATLMPVGGGGSGAGMAAILSAQLGMGGGSGGETSSQLVPILTSKSLALKVIDKYDLLPDLYPGLWDANAKAWLPGAEAKIKDTDDMVIRFFKLLTVIDDKKKQTIVLRAVTLDPSLSAKLVNSSLFELQNELESNIYTSSKRNRIFIGEQLQDIKMKYLNNSKELSFFYENNKISSAHPFVDVDISEVKPPINAVEKLTEEVLAPEATGVNVKELLKRAIQNNQSLDSKLSDVNYVTGPSLAFQIPQQTYYQYLLGKQKVNDQLIVILAQKYEMARIEEAKEDLNFTVIDWAQVPVKKFKPARSRIVIQAFMISAFFAILLAFFLEYLKNNPIKQKLR